MTHWLALDLTQSNGIRLLQQALYYLVMSNFNIVKNHLVLPVSLGLAAVVEVLWDNMYGAAE